MSNIFGLFGSRKKDNKEEIKQKSLEAIQNLKNKIRDTEEKIIFLETKKNNQNEIAKEKLKKGDKLGAKKALAAKKKFEEQIKIHDGAMMMMEEQQIMLENAQSLKDVFKTVSDANNAIKNTNAAMKIEDLDKIKDDMEDIKAQQEEVNEFFTGYAVADNEELDEELAAMEKEILNEELPEPVKDKAKKKIEEIQAPINSEKDKDLNDLESFLI